MNFFRAQVRKWLTTFCVVQRGARQSSQAGNQVELEITLGTKISPAIATLN